MRQHDPGGPVTRHASSHRGTRGQSLVEFALIFPVLIVILLGIFDLGRAVFAYSSLTNAAREGARLGIVNQSDAMIKARAIAQGRTIDTDPAAIEIFISSPTSAPDDDDCRAAVRIDCNVTVRYATEFEAITPVIGALVGPITLTAQSVEPIENVCGVAGALVTDPALCPKQP